MSDVKNEFGAWDNLWEWYYKNRGQANKDDVKR